MGTAKIKMEFIAGSTIEDSFIEAIRLATLLTCWIEFNFNGVTCIASNKGTMAKGCIEYHKALGNSGRKGIAFS